MLDVADLKVAFGAAQESRKTVVQNVTFSVKRERVGLIGESGSGKSTIARTLLGILPHNAQVTASRLSLHGKSLLSLGEREWRRIRGRHVGYIPQDARMALNPVMTIERQVAAALRKGQGLSEKAANTASLDALRAVQIREPAHVAKLFPHQVSGGMAQRIITSMILASSPDLLIADEPTSALDATVRLKILDLLNALVEQHRLGLVLISHDLNLVRRYTDRVIVLYAGRIMETCKSDELLNAGHPYTRGLIACRPSLQRRVEHLPELQRQASWG